MDPDQQTRVDQARAQAFLDTEGDLSPGELSDVQVLVGQHFNVSAPEGPINEVTLTLETIEPQKKYTGNRESIRREPYTLLFSGPLSPQLESSLYKLASKSGSKVMILYVKFYDTDESANKALYEAVIN